MAKKMPPSPNPGRVAQTPPKSPVSPSLPANLPTGQVPQEILRKGFRPDPDHSEGDK